MRNKIRFNFLKYWDFLKTHVLAVLFKGVIHKLLKQMRGRGRGLPNPYVCLRGGGEVIG